MVDAINHALKEEMERNPKMIIFGQDVADGKGGSSRRPRGSRGNLEAIGHSIRRSQRQASSVLRPAWN
jgi:pyruvate/2-oxoglutarate/acetoin dehydrogenase E1 component